MGISIRTLSGREDALQNEALDDLRASLDGTLLTPGQRGYDDARTIWNGMIDRRPALVAHCTTAGDVANAVRFARENALLT